MKEDMPLIDRDDISLHHETTQEDRFRQGYLTEEEVQAHWRNPDSALFHHQLSGREVIFPLNY